MANFWFKFEWDVWRGDRQLRRCSKETRGFWIDSIAEMEAQETYYLEGTPLELCRDLNSTFDEFERSIAELDRTGAATIEKNQTVVKILSRRLLRKINLTEYNRLKQQERRQRLVSNGGQDTLSKIQSSESLRVQEESSKQDSKNDAETAAEHPVERRIWKDGIDLLNKSGLTEKQARPLLGRLAKDYGNELLAESIAATQAKNPADPVPFLIAVLKRRSSPNPNALVGKHDPSTEEPLQCQTCLDTGEIRQKIEGSDWQVKLVPCPECAAVAA